METVEKSTISIPLDIAEKYKTIGIFQHGFAVVSTMGPKMKSDGTTYPYEWFGIIDTTGKEISKCVWDKIEIISDKLFIVYESSKRYSFMNEKSEIIYDWVESKPQVIMVEGRMFFIIDSKRVIDSDLKEVGVFKDKFNYVTHFYKNDIYFLVRNNSGKESIVTIKGDVIINWFEDINTIDINTGRCGGDNKTGYFLVKDRNSEAIIDESGKCLIKWSESITFDEVGRFFKIRQNGRYSLFCPRTKTQSDWYDFISTKEWTKNLAPARKDGLYGFIDIRDGKLAVPCKYYKVKLFDKHGHARVKTDNSFFGIGSWVSIGIKRVDLY